MTQLARKRELNQLASRRRAIGALLASFIPWMNTREGPTMVATRDEILNKALIRGRKLRPAAKPAPSAPRPRPVYVMEVGEYTVTTNASGETIATIEDGSTLEFRGPGDLPLARLNEFACRFLERRGPGYAPRTSLVITLDGRGRKRESVEA